MFDNFKDLLDLGKPYLKPYLQDMGIEIVKKGHNEFLRCINPEHEDRHPSCSLYPDSDNQVYVCFSCNLKFYVYNSAHFLEDKPLYGSGFIKDNVEYILNRYRVEYTPIEFTEEQLSRFKYEQVYSYATRLLTSVNKDTGEYLYSTTKYAKDRGWGDVICQTLGIATVLNYPKYISALSKIVRLPIENLEKMGINSRLFGPNYLTFSVRDSFGEIKGYASRFIPWKEDSKETKYTNTSLDENPFYRKDQLLYGLDIAKRYKDLRLDIFEGYGSLVTAQQAGHKNCCSIGGTALTENHVNIIRNLGFRHINLVLDVDRTGKDKMNRYIDKFSGYNGLEVTIMHLLISEEELEQSGKNDPDYFISTYGLEKYRSLKMTDLFEHMIHKSTEFKEDDPMAQEFCKRILPLIINQPDHIRRGKMISSLASHTHVDKDDIKLEIGRLEKSDIRSIKDDLAKRIRNAVNPDQMQDILNSALTNLEETSSTKKDRYLISIAETVEAYDDIFQEMNAAPEGIHGWVTGYGALDNLLDGIPRPGKAGGRVIGFCGSASHGKSAALLNIAINAALLNKEISILYWAIDDNRKSILYRLVSMLSEVPMKKVTNRIPRTPDEAQAIQEAQEKLRQLVLDRKLVFKDDKFGRGKTKAEAWIKETQDNTGNEILFCVDSLHNIAGSSGQETRVKIMSSSSWLKVLATSTPCSILATIELVKNRKKGEKPTLQSIMECITGDTLITLENRTQVPIIDIKKGDRVLTLNVHGKLVPERVLAKKENGIKKVYKLTLSSGKVIKATSNHPFWTIDGWKNLEHLNKDIDWIATAALGTRNLGEATYSPELCRYLGYMVGDGSYRTRSCIAFINKDRDIIRDIEKIVLNHFNIASKRRNIHGSLDIRWTTERGKPNCLIDFFTKIGLRGGIDYNKEVPSFIFKEDRENILQYLSGYLMTDGCIMNNPNQTPVVRFDSTSLKLLEQCQLLFYQLGYMSKLDYRGKLNTKSKRLIYRLNLDTFDIYPFLSEIELVGRKEDIRRKFIVNYVPQKIKNYNNLPPILTQIVKRKRADQGLERKTKSGWWAQKSRTHAYKCMNRQSLLENATELKDGKLYILSQSEINWEKISSIEQIEDQETYCLEIENNHNFICNSMITHNSGKLEFDFDALSVVWNEAQGYFTDPGSVSAKWGTPGNWKPVIELDFQKNKSGSGEKGSIYFRLDTETTRFVSCSRNKQDVVSKYSNTSEIKSDGGTLFSFAGMVEEEEEEEEHQQENRY